MLPVPCILLVLIATVVTIWMHVVGHSSMLEAQSSHIAPIMLLCSIVTAAGVIGFFLTHVSMALTMRAFSCCVKYVQSPFQYSSHVSVASPYEYYQEDDYSPEDNEEQCNAFHGEFIIGDEKTTIVSDKNKETPMQHVKTHKSKKVSHKKESLPNYNTDDTDDSASDMDQYAYESSGLVDYSAPQNTSSIQQQDVTTKKKLLTGDILTVTMVWTNVYGLGLACFLLMPIITMASTLATYTFIVGLNIITLYEMLQERRDPSYRFRQWRAGRVGARVRNGLHSAAFFLANVVIILMGMHVASIHMNKIGQIKVEDVFFGIVGPLLAPLLLKGVRRPHTTILGTMELALPCAAFLACAFMISVLAMGMRPYEVKDQLSRNMVASTILLPGFFGGVIMYTLHCVLRRRILYVLCTFLVVFVGRQFTFSKQQSVVSSSLVMATICFLVVVVTSSKPLMNFISKSPA